MVIIKFISKLNKLAGFNQKSIVNEDFYLSLKQECLKINL